MSGFVSLVGAGPGDEELISIKGARRLEEADVLIYDRLVNPMLLSYTKSDCEKIYVGKIPNQPCVSQEEIEEVLVEKAKAGKKVVRLKSGDPYIFGRGGEEAQTLIQEGIPFEVVPGITSAIAGLAYAGIPMTFRNIATSFHVFTGHLQDASEALNWDAISHLKGTLVFLMGMKNLQTICEELMVRGYDKETPVAIIEWATHPQQRSIDGKLETIVELAEKHQMKAPSLIVIGDVVAFREELNYHEKLPLFGRTVLVQETPNAKLPKLLRDAGATVYAFQSPSKLLAKELQIPQLSSIDGLVVTDPSSWNFFVAYLQQEDLDIRSLSHLKIVASGHHTIKTIKEAGIRLYDQINDVADENFVKRMREQEGNWIILTSDIKEKAVAEVLNFPIHTTHSVAFESESFAYHAEDIQLICLPNSAAAYHFVLMAEKTQENWKEKPIVIMGDNTRSVLEKAGYHQLIETEERTLKSVCEACQTFFRRESEND